jgi:hypothetical protein
MKLKLKRNDIYILKADCIDKTLHKEIKIHSTDKFHVFADIDEETTICIRNKDFTNYIKKGN